MQVTTGIIMTLIEVALWSICLGFVLWALGVLGI